MAKRGHSEEAILRVLREAESGETVVEVCRKHGISQQTFYLWKKKYAGLGLSELRELRQLREENGKLKRLVADLSLDRHILQEWAQQVHQLSQRRAAGLIPVQRRLCVIGTTAIRRKGCGCDCANLLAVGFATATGG
jgi:putative transposase